MLLGFLEVENFFRDFEELSFKVGMIGGGVDVLYEEVIFLDFLLIWCLFCYFEGWLVVVVKERIFLLSIYLCVCFNLLSKFK